MKQEKSKPLSVQLAYEDYERLLQIEQEYLGRKEQQVKKRNLIKGLKGLRNSSCVQHLQPGVSRTRTGSDRHWSSTGVMCWWMPTSLGNLQTSTQEDVSIIGQGRTLTLKEGSDMAKDITVHKSFSLIEKFSKNDSLTANEKMLLKYLPHKVQNIIWELHSSMMFPISYCFSAIMTAASGSIANSKALCTQNGYIVYPSIFMAIIGESGENKSQPIKWFMRPLWTRTAEMLKDYNGELDAYLKEVAKGNFEMDKPKKVQFIIQDATIEAIKEILYENPRGLLVIFDELISWIKSFSRYKLGKASEEGEWIVICDGDSLMVNRKGDARVLYIKHPFVALIGSIQPYVLCDAFKGSGMEDGLLWRIFMTYSEHPASPILWNDNKPDENLQDQWSEIITAILDQSFDADYDCPKALRYTDNAWTVIRGWQNMKEEDYTANHSQKELSVWRKVQVSVHKISICLKELWKACGEDVLEIGEGDNGVLPTDDDPLGNENFIGMQMGLDCVNDWSSSSLAILPTFMTQVMVRG